MHIFYTLGCFKYEFSSNVSTYRHCICGRITFRDSVWWSGDADVGIFVSEVVKDGKPSYLTCTQYDPSGIASLVSCQYTLMWTSFCRSEFLFCSSRQVDAASFRQRASRRMSHGEHNCAPFCALDFYFYTANENISWKEMSVPCTEPPEPSARSSGPSAWPPPHCCRPPHPNGSSSRSPPRTPSPPWSRPPCSRFSPQHPPVRPLCRPRGSGPWRWRPGPPLSAS